MGNEQSGEGQAVPETGLRLSTLCRYQQAESGVCVFCVCEKEMTNIFLYVFVPYHSQPILPNLFGIFKANRLKSNDVPPPAPPSPRPLYLYPREEEHLFARRTPASHRLHCAPELRGFCSAMNRLLLCI